MNFHSKAKGKHIFAHFSIPMLSLQSRVFGALVGSLFLTSLSYCSGDNEEQRVKVFLEKYNREAIDDNNKLMLAYWARVTNINNKTKAAEDKAFLENTKFWGKMNLKAKKFDMKLLPEGSLKRQLSKLRQSGLSVLSKTDLAKFSTASGNMQSQYSGSKVCLVDYPCMYLTPGLTNIMASSSDYNKTKKVWQAWRDASGKKMKTDFQEMIRILNKAAKMNGFKDEGDRWRSLYETPTFRSDMENMYQTLKPLYQHLHAYVRRALKKEYGERVFPKSGHIPANILGNMWAQHWNNIESKVKPYPNQKSPDTSARMKEQGYTAKKMFKTAESFFVSIGLPKMVDSFWKKSMITRPADGHKVICHPSAEDFYKNSDFRIKMCSEVKFEDLVTIHHEMGHIEYFMAYEHQPILFRDGANAGFHEAIGNVMSISVSTPEHLHKIGLMEKPVNNAEHDINFLMSRALDTIAFLPFGYMIDNWRWGVFDGTTPPDRYNEHWWAARCKYQGIYPPVPRKIDDFDPGAKFHVAANVAYIRYFVAYNIEYQFHKALCKEAKFEGPLYKCSIYQSKAAGKKLLDMLKMGSSKPWPEAMKVISGSDKMEATAMMEYFEPLLNWLKKQNQDHTVGWTDECPPGTFGYKVKPEDKTTTPSIGTTTKGESGAVVMSLSCLSFVLCLFIALV